MVSLPTMTPLTLPWRLARSITERISRSLRSLCLSIQAPTVTRRPNSRGDAGHQFDAAGGRIGADGAGQRRQQLEVGANLFGLRLVPEFGMGVAAKRRIGNAGELAIEIGSAQVIRASAHNPACTHATRAITAATERIDLQPTGAGFQTLEPVPWAQPKLVLRRCSIARHQAEIQVIPAHGNSLPRTWRENIISQKGNARQRGTVPAAAAAAAGRPPPGAGQGPDRASRRGPGRSGCPGLWGRCDPAVPGSGKWPGYASLGSRNGRKGRGGGRRCRGRRARAG